MIISAGSVNRDHLHMLIGIPHQLSLSKAVQYLKGKNSRKLLSEFNSLRKRYWGQHLWARGYWVASSGNVTDDVWKQYIEGCRKRAYRGALANAGPKASLPMPLAARSIHKTVNGQHWAKKNIV